MAKSFSSIYLHKNHLLDSDPEDVGRKLILFIFNKLTIGS